MPKTDFEYVAAPNENNSTTIEADWLDKINAAVPTGEDIDGSLPLLYAVDSGAADAYVMTMAFGYGSVSFPQALIAGLELLMKVGGGNTNTGASTLNVNAIGAKNIKMPDGSDPKAGTLRAGEIVRLRYDGTNFILLEHPDKRNEYYADSGSADAYAVTPAPAYTAYFAGMKILIKTANANTGASTLNVNALGTKAIKKLASQALDANNILAGQIVLVVYDGTNFQLVGAVAGFGAWLSRSNNTVYQAATDGFVCAINSAGGTTLEGYTDGSTPPTIKRGQHTLSDAGSLCIPVRKNDYWKIVGADTVYWISKN